MFQMPTCRCLPASVSATKWPSCDSSGCWTVTPSNCAWRAVSMTFVSPSAPSFVRMTLEPRMKTISSGPAQLPQVAFSTTIVSSPPPEGIV